MFKHFVGDISSFCGGTDTPVFGFTASLDNFTCLLASCQLAWQASHWHKCTCEQTLVELQIRLCILLCMLQSVTLGISEPQVLVVLSAPEIRLNRNQATRQHVTKSVMPSLVDRMTSVQSAVSNAGYRISLRRGAKSCMKTMTLRSLEVKWCEIFRAHNETLTSFPFAVSVSDCLPGWRWVE